MCFFVVCRPSHMLFWPPTLISFQDRDVSTPRPQIPLKRRKHLYTVTLRERDQKLKKVTDKHRTVTHFDPPYKSGHFGPGWKNINILPFGPCSNACLFAVKMWLFVSLMGRSRSSFLEGLQPFKFDQFSPSDLNLNPQQTVSKRQKSTSTQLFLFSFFQRPEMTKNNRKTPKNDSLRIPP